MATTRTHRRALQGLVYLLAIATFVTASVQVYRKAMPWQRTDEVSFETTQAGLGLSSLSDVKYQGVLVGTVRRVTTTGTVATVTLAIDPDHIGEIPNDVDAMVVPKTLFGDKFVDLRQTAESAGADPLEAGDTIVQSRTAVELGQIFDKLVPVLRTLQPARLNAVLTELADVLDGRGERIARTLTTTDALLTRLEPSYDDLVADLQLLADVGDTYTAAAPDLLQILSDATAISDRDLVPHEQDLQALLTAATATAGSTRNVLRDNGDALVRLGGRARPVLEVLDYYAREVPCVLEALDYGNRLANLASGVRGPYIALSVDMVVDQRGYANPSDLPSNPSSDANNRNLPREIPSTDPHCPRLPDRVRALPKSPPPYSQQPYAQTFDSRATTPTPREALANAIAAQRLGVDLDDLPAYAGLLVQPLTGGEVELR